MFTGSTVAFTYSRLTLGLTSRHRFCHVSFPFIMSNIASHLFKLLFIVTSSVSLSKFSLLRHITLTFFSYFSYFQGTATLRCKLLHQQYVIVQMVQPQNRILSHEISQSQRLSKPPLVATLFTPVLYSKRHVSSSERSSYTAAALQTTHGDQIIFLHSSQPAQWYVNNTSHKNIDSLTEIGKIPLAFRFLVTSQISWWLWCQWYLTVLFLLPLLYLGRQLLQPSLSSHLMTPMLFSNPGKDRCPTFQGFFPYLQQLRNQHRFWSTV